MANVSEKFVEQFPHIQKQFQEWTHLEQLHAVVELTRTFQLSYRYFLSQLFQAHIQYENNDLFNHTVDGANTPEIVNCLLSNPIDKILFTIQLYLPLITTETINEKLLDAYRNVLKHLDLNLDLIKFSCTEQQRNFSLQILFFIQTNPCLISLLSHLSQLVKLVQTNRFNPDKQQYPRLLQSTATVPCQIQPLMNVTPDNVHNMSTCEPLTRHEISDSGVDLTEPCITDSIQSFLSYQNHQNLSFGRSERANLSSTLDRQLNVVKTTSSPISEHVTVNTSAHVPLHAVFSAPSPAVSSDNHHNNSTCQQQKSKSILMTSDEDEQQSQKPYDNNMFDQTNLDDNSKRLKQYYSLRYSNSENKQKKDAHVLQYLGVDVKSTSMLNTFKQPNTGMRVVPKWLKSLRLHKYDVFFSQMTYDRMMNLTLEELKELRITDGACTKILLNIKKLKDRSTVLNRILNDIDNEATDVRNVLQQLNDIMITPIRSRQLELENNGNEDLPSLIIQILGKISQQVTPNSAPDIGNTLLGLFDLCYKHDAFTDEQRHQLLKWRGRISNMLQSMGRIEYKAIQSSHMCSSPQRRIAKPLVRHIKSTSAAYHTNYSPNFNAFSKQKSDLTNNSSLESNPTRSSTKQSMIIPRTFGETNDHRFPPSFGFITSTPQRNNTGRPPNQECRLLTRTSSSNCYDETHARTRMMLGRTSSDLNRTYFNNAIHTQLASAESQMIQQQNLFHLISRPYSHQQEQFISPPTPASTMDISASSIKTCQTENERSNYYGNSNTTASLSSTNEANESENTDDQQHNNSEFESFCHKITEIAINDEFHDSSVNREDEVSGTLNVKQPSNNSTDIEQ